MKKRRTKAWRWLGGGGAVLLLLFLRLPVITPSGDYSRVLLDRDERLLGAEVSADQQWRFPPVSTVPEKFEAALLAFEDRRFYYHPGVDPLGVARAAWTNLRAGRVVSGASTLTMQVVRLSLGNPPRTVGHKLKEAALALRLDLAKSKREILALYANHAPFGGNVVGLEAAAWRYFARPPRELTWAEAATLAVLPNSPSLIHPGRGRAALEAKRNRLLARLRTNGALDASTYEAAVKEPLPRAPAPLVQAAPHVLHGYADRQTRFVSTIDRGLQARVGAALDRALPDLAGIGVHNAAAVVAHVPTGEILAYVGNRTFPVAAEHSPHVDVARASRSTGSLLKPVLYGLMLESGALLPSALVPDVPVRLGGFRPLNYDRRFRGAVPADEALARSLNVPAALLLRRYGQSRFLLALKHAGLAHLNRPASYYGLSLILGGAEAPLVELLDLYAQLGWRAQHYATPWPGLRMERFGAPLRADTTAQLGISQAAAYLTVKALYEVRRPGNQGRWRTFGSGRPVAWKTGTSYGFRDAWAIGVTPTYAVAVWTGNADGEGRPGLTGFEAAAPILFSLFDLLPASAPFTPPANGLTSVVLCAHSGHVATPSCPHTRVGEVLSHPGSTTAYAKPCPYCRSVPSTKDGRFRVHADCARLSEIHAHRRFVLPPRQAHYYRQWNVTYRGLPPLRPGCEPPDASSPEASDLAILFPREGGELYIPRELSRERSKVVFAATHRKEGARIFWHLDDRFLGTTEHFHEIEVAPAPGPHVLTLVDDRGQSLRRRFEILAVD